MHPASAATDPRMSFAFYYVEIWLSASDKARNNVCAKYNANKSTVINDFTNYYQRAFNNYYGPYLKPPAIISLASVRLTVTRSLGYDCSMEGRKHWHDTPMSQ